jgi:hypothetical protein
MACFIHSGRWGCVPIISLNYRSFNQHTLSFPWLHAKNRKKSAGGAFYENKGKYLNKLFIREK